MLDNEFDPMDQKNTPSPADNEGASTTETAGSNTAETPSDAPVNAGEESARPLEEADGDAPSSSPDDDEDLTNFYNFHPGYNPPPNASSPKSSGNGNLAVILVCVLVFLCLIGLAVVGTLGLGMGGLPSILDGSSNTSQETSLDGSSTGSSLSSSENNSSGTHSYTEGDLDINLGSVASSTENQTGVLVAKKVCPSVVGVLTYDEYRGEYELIGSGSGIILSEDGFIVTNQHVIDGADKVAVALYSDVGMNEEDSYLAEVVGEDATTDIALLKIDTTGLIPAEFVNTDQVLVGETVFAVGNPGGIELSASISQGLVSGLNRNLGSTSLIQTDVAINPGSSGGALVNVHGQVIGITSEKIVSVSSVSAEGLGFAIPTNVALPILDELLTHGYVTGRVALKITVRVYTDAYAQMEGLPENCRLCVDSVEEGSNAAQAGLREGYFITHFNGVSIHALEELKTERDKCSTGDTVKLTVYIPESKNTKEVSFVLEEDRG